MVLYQLVAALLAQPVPSPAPEFSVFERTEVVRVSPRPCCGSGVVMFLTDFDILTPDGRPQNLTMIYMGEDQFIPPVGSTCRIAFDRSGIRGDDGRLYPNLVRRLDCDTGSDSVHLSGGGARIEGARIVGVSPPPRRHARYALYAAVEINSPGRTIQRLYLPRRGDGRSQPTVGVRCTVTYHLDWVTGRSLGMPWLEGELVRIVDEMDCGTQTAAAD